MLFKFRPYRGRTCVDFTECQIKFAWNLIFIWPLFAYHNLHITYNIKTTFASSILKVYYVAWRWKLAEKVMLLLQEWTFWFSQETFPSMVRWYSGPVLYLTWYWNTHPSLSRFSNRIHLQWKEILFSVLNMKWRKYEFGTSGWWLCRDFQRENWFSLAAL